MVEERWYLSGIVSSVDDVVIVIVIVLVIDACRSDYDYEHENREFNACGRLELKPRRSRWTDVCPVNECSS